MGARTPLHVRGRELPGDEPAEWWIVDGVLSAEPVSGADTVFGADGDGGWIIPGLVDAHCHVGLGVHGATDLDEAIGQAETERAAGALLLRDAGSPVDTRSLDDRDDLPRIIRAGRHIARPKRYSPGLPIDIEDESQLPDVVAEQARFGDGWVKLVGDWIDRGVGDLAPLWSDDILVAAIDAAHANGARVTAHVFGEDALPGLLNAGIDCIEHGTGLTEETIALMLEHGTALVPTLINIDNFPGIADAAAAKYPTYAEAHARPVRVVPGSASAPPARPVCRSTPGPTPAHGGARPHRRRGGRTAGGRDDRHRGARSGVVGCTKVVGPKGNRAWRVGRPALLLGRPAPARRARPSRPGDPSRPGVPVTRVVDLSHPIRAGLVTYPGLPAPVITPHLTREDSRARYAPGTEFAMDVITMIGNTGTYLDSPFHRYADGADLAGLDLSTLVGLRAEVFHLTDARRRRVTAGSAPGLLPAGTCAVPPCCCTPDGTATSERPNTVLAHRFSPLTARSA